MQGLIPNCYDSSRLNNRKKNEKEKILFAAHRIALIDNFDNKQKVNFYSNKYNNNHQAANKSGASTLTEVIYLSDIFPPVERQEEIINPQIINNNIK